MDRQKIVTPVKTGVQTSSRRIPDRGPGQAPGTSSNLLDSGFRRNDRNVPILTFYGSKSYIINLLLVPAVVKKEKWKKSARKKAPLDVKEPFISNCFFKAMGQRARRYGFFVFLSNLMPEFFV
jgi:hypothetical protein